MRWLVLILFVFSLGVFGAYIFLRDYPHGLYSSWASGFGWNRYYRISNFNKSLLAPSTIEEIPYYEEDYVQLWKSFPIGNSLVPLPTRHPLFITVPLIEIKSKDSKPQIGMTFLSSEGREISRLYVLPISIIKDYSLGQELFKLPFVKHRILKIDQDKLWRDIFSHEIEKKSKSIDEMIHDLYILHLRSKILPPQTLKYGLLKDGKAIIELNSADKDYVVELIMNQDSGSIYSYLLKTEKHSVESQKLRSKFVQGINFSPADSSMGRILYTEFKQLNFARQVDQEGMLYLFSAWSQEIEKMEMLREMIFYLERGRNNIRQLRPLYEYALKRYGKTFTKRRDFSGFEDQDLVLTQKIEIEEKDKERKSVQEANATKTQVNELSPEEKMNLYLKKAKEEKPLESEDITIH